MTKICRESPPVILIVDDLIPNYIILEEYLSEFDVNVLHAKNGLEAVDLVKKVICIKLVLMDINMPIMNGIDATKVIKSVCPELKIIGVTANTDSNLINQMITNGCEECIFKPVNLEVITNLIHTYL